MKIRVSIFYLLITIAIATSQSLTAQEIVNRHPGNIYPAVIDRGDTIASVTLREHYIFPPLKFKSKRAEKLFWRDVQDVKKTLPYAKIVYATLIETYEYMEYLPTKEEKDAHLKRMEDELFKEYMPVLKKFNFRQGKLLIRLIDRECNQSSFHLIKAFLGDFRANFWQLFGAMFGASLKADWDPDGKDAQLEKICRMVEVGAI